MKKVLALALVGSLAGCATTWPNSVASIVTQIQSAAVNVCGYLPVAEDITTIVATLAGGGALIGQIEQIAQEICAAAVTVPIAKAGRYGAKKYHTVLVRNVPVRVKFVR